MFSDLTQIIKVANRYKIESLNWCLTISATNGGDLRDESNERKEKVRDSIIHSGKFRWCLERRLWVFLFKNSNNHIRVGNPFVINLHHWYLSFWTYLQEPIKIKSNENSQI